VLQERARGRADAGNALVIALLVLLVLSSAGVAFVAVTKSEKQISGNQMTSAQALYAAEAGLTEGLRRMSSPSDTANFIGEPGAATPGWGRYVVIANGASALDPNAATLEADGLNNDGDGFVDESGERYPEVMSKQTGANRLVYPYVRLEYKMQGGQLVRFGDADQNPMTPPTENMTYGAPVLRVTTSGRKGSAKKYIEAEAVRFPLVDVGAALWAGGPIAFKGNAFIIDGHDHQAESPHDTIPGAKPMKGIMTQGPTSDAQLSGFQEDNVLGEGGTGSVEQSPYTYDFNAIWAQLSNLADNAFTGDQTFDSGTPVYGTLSSPEVTVVKGNLDCNGTWEGAGFLMVDGNLSMGGGSTFSGVVVVTGDVKLTGGGPADDARIVGGIIYQGSLVNASLQGGAGRVWYSSQAVNAALTLGHYTLSSWHER
jgi:hypothetical protein